MRVPMLKQESDFVSTGERAEVYRQAAEREQGYLERIESLEKQVGSLEQQNSLLQAKARKAYSTETGVEWKELFKREMAQHQKYGVCVLL